MRTRRLKLAIATVALLLPVALPSGVLAACEPPRAADEDMWFVGAVRTPGGAPRAMQAKIEAYSPYIETGAPTSAWTMLNRGGDRWAQIGWWKKNGGARNTFVQWTDNNNHWFTKEFNAPAIGATPNYETVYNPFVNATFLFKMDNAVMWQADALWQPLTVQVNGELHNMANQMPGGFNATVSLSEAHYTMGAGWLNINVAPGNSDPGNFGVQKINGEYYTIWDRDCQF